MTKEEILWLKPQPTPNSVTMRGAKEAMDEYAKQQAIAFDEWKINQGWTNISKGKWAQGVFYAGAKSSKELYDQFIESQNKQP